MPFAEITPEQIDQLIDTRDAATGIAFPRRGLQPYFNWLIQTLAQLAAASAGDLRPGLADTSATRLWIAPGRCALDGAARAWPGGELELATFNNSTALVWARASEQGLAIDAADASEGWPRTPHLRLARVTLQAGAIASVEDLRFETVLRAGDPVLRSCEANLMPPPGVPGRLIYRADLARVCIDTGAAWLALQSEAI